MALQRPIADGSKKRIIAKEGKRTTKSNEGGGFERRAKSEGHFKGWWVARFGFPIKNSRRGDMLANRIMEGEDRERQPDSGAFLPRQDNNRYLLGAGRPVDSPNIKYLSGIVSRRPRQLVCDITFEQ